VEFVSHHNAAGNRYRSLARSLDLSARYTFFYRGIHSASAIAFCGSEADDGAVGHHISSAIVHRLGFDENSSSRALALDAKIARIGSHLLHGAPCGEIVQ
jgi:hypothetical protein